LLLQLWAKSYVGQGGLFFTRFSEGGQEVVGRRVVLRKVLFDFISLMKPSCILTLVSLATVVSIVTRLFTRLLRLVTPCVPIKPNDSPCVYRA